MGVSIHPPKTPVTAGSNGIASATLPNVCKMPGPPAPFVPAPLPNIGKSGDSPKGYSKTVVIEGKAIAIKGASFGSTGDMASKGTGGGMVSASVHGRTTFAGPGSMSVKVEGKNVHLLGDPMLNNGAGSGMPANSATLTGLNQKDQSVDEKEICPHTKTRREPPADFAIKKPENAVKAAESKVRKLEKRKAKLEQKKANVANSPVKVAEIDAELMGVEKNLAGFAFEAKVAREELEKGRLREMNVRIVCCACGKDQTDFDIITSDEQGKPVMKECKSGGNFDEAQSINQTALIEEHLPGGELHLTATAESLEKKGRALKKWDKPQKTQAH
jgi:hypothetical protein